MRKSPLDKLTVTSLTKHVTCRKSSSAMPGVTNSLPSGGAASSSSASSISGGGSLKKDSVANLNLLSTTNEAKLERPEIKYVFHNYYELLSLFEIIYFEHH